MAQPHELSPNGFDASFSFEEEIKNLRNRVFVHEVGYDDDKQIVEFVRDASGIIIGNQPLDPRIYSEMKHGNPDYIALASREIFQKLLSDPRTQAAIASEQVVITTSSRLVPKASSVLMEHLIEHYLTPYRESIGLSPMPSALSRKRAFLSSGDYGKLNKADRIKRTIQEGTYFEDDDHPKFIDSTVLVFDDLVASGTFEVDQKLVLNRLGVPNHRIIPIYWMQITPETASDPTFEHAINYSAVSTYDDLLRFFYSPELVINERTTKFMFSIADDAGGINEEKRAAFIAFLQALGAHEAGQRTLQKMHRAVNTPDGYTKILRFQEGCSILENYLTQLGLL